MTTSAHDLLVRLDATTEQLRRELARADQTVGETSRRIDQQLSRVDAAFERLNRTATMAAAGVVKGLGLMGIALGAAELVEGIGNALDGMLEIQRTAAGLGISTKAVQELSYTFKQFGVDNDDVTEGLAQLSGQALGAIQGSSGLIQTWGELGITVDQLKGKKPDELFRLLAQGIAQTEDPTVRLSAASTLLGEDLAGKLMPLLVGGTDALDKYGKNLKDVGGLLDDSLVNKGAKAAQVIKEVKAQFTASFNRLVAENADQIAQLAKDLAAVAEAAFDAVSGISRFYHQLTGTEDKITNLIRVRDKWLKAGYTANDPLIKMYNNQIAALVRERDRQREQVMPAVTVHGTTPAADTTKKITPFRPIDGFLDAVDKAHQEKWLKWADNTPKAINKEQVFADFEFDQLDKKAAPDDSLQYLLPKKGSESIEELQDQLKGLTDQTNEFRDIAVHAGEDFASSFTDAIFQAKGLGEVFRSLTEDIAKMMMKMVIMKSLQGAFPSVFGGGSTPTHSAKGNVFGPSGLMAFANGGIFGGSGIVNTPTLFQFANGTGLMGEAGPEAIMPLRRGPGGKLGVVASGGSGVVINVNNNSSEAHATAQSRRGPDGQYYIDILVEDTFNRLLSNGRLDKSLQANMGVRRPGKF